ncbi:U3 snoRNP protein [Microbotryomycetes sp. JL201]|nr:U3 snoRNP protein [Microbotryomycetes sp. JL201]
MGTTTRDGQSRTLRSLRHDASAHAPGRKRAAKPHAAAQLTRRERIDKQGLKPLIKGRQFKFVSPAQRMRSMQVDMRRVQDRRDMLEGEDEALATDNEAHSLFGHALAQSHLNNLSLPFVKFYRAVEPKARSLPLVVHYRDDIVLAICSSLTLPLHDVELCGETILDLLPPLVTDLDRLLLPYLPTILTTLVALTIPSPLTQATPQLLQRVYDVLGAIFRDLGRHILAAPPGDAGSLDVIWKIIRRGLGAPAKQLDSMQGHEVKQDQEPASDQDDASDMDGEDAAPVASTSKETSSTSFSGLSTSLPAHFRTTPQTRRLLASSFAFLVRKARSTSKNGSLSGEIEPLFGKLFDDLAQVEQDDGAHRQIRKRGHTLLRPKGKGRGQEDGSSVLLAEGLTWLTAEACCAANQVLHSRTPAILRSMYASALDKASSGCQLPRDVITHVLIVIAAHVETAEPIDAVIEEVLRGVTQADDQASQSAAIGALQTLLTTRKGERISGTAKSRVLSSLTDLAKFVTKQQHLDSHFVDIYSSLILSAAQAASLQELLSGGFKIAFEGFFAQSALSELLDAGCAILCILDKLDWPQFPAFVSPILFTNGKRGLESSAGRKWMALVARLARTGRLTTMLSSTSVSASLFEQVLRSRCSEDTELLDALSIVAKLKSSRTALQSDLVQLCVRYADSSADVAQADYMSSPANPAQILAVALETVTGAATADLAPLAFKIVDRYSWHRGVMASVSNLAIFSPTSAQDEESASLIHSIHRNLLSEDSLLRLSSLRLVAAFFPANDKRIEADLISKCIEVEHLALTVMGAREKSMKIRKIGIIAHAQLDNVEDTRPILDIVIRYLTAMLKLNFKPVWPEAIQALSLLAEKYAEQVWQITSTQLLSAATRSDDLYVSQKPTWARRTALTASEPVFEEKELRDFHVEDPRTRVVAERQMFAAIGPEDIQEAGLDHLKDPQITTDRLVIQSYEAQLLALFCALPDLAQKHSRDFVEVFLGCFQRDEDEIEGNEQLRRYVHEQETTKERKQRLLAWLALFAKFSSPKALFRSTELDTLFRRQLAFPDAAVQKLALDCLLRWKVPAVNANADRLRNMLEPTKLRDELLQFVSTTDAGGLDPSHRADVVPLIIRISYGIMTSRLGRASASSGQGRAGRRAAILGALKTCSPQELDTLVDLTLGPLHKLLASEAGRPFVFAQTAPNIPGRRQVGFLSLLADIIKHLGIQLVHRWHDLMGSTLNLLYFAQKGIENEVADREQHEPMEDEAEQAEEEDEENESDDAVALAPLRHIRQLALKRWTDFFKLEVTFDYSPYAEAAFPDIISPRLPTLPMENAQAPSALLELFASWAARRDLVEFLVRFDGQLLPSLYRVLTVRNVKPTVVLRVFDIVMHLLDFASEEGGQDSDIGRSVVRPSVQTLLSQLSGLLESTSASADARAELAQRQISVLCALAPYIKDQEQALKLLSLIVPLLRKTNKVVPEKVKTDLLKIFSALYPLARPDSSSALQLRCFEVVSALFLTARTRNARLQAVAAFRAFTEVETSFSQVAQLVQELNSYSVKRSEEPDFDRRLAAFNLLKEQLFDKLTAVEWMPLINCMLFFVQDPEELAIRSNASFSLRRFIEVAANTIDDETRSTLTRVLLPGLRNCMRNKLEIVRAEVLGVYASAVEKVDGVPELDQLKCLLVDGDQEANFFYNVLHIQVHRRTRALRRLAEEVERGSMKSKVVADVFLPLIDQFIVNAEGGKDADLVNETVQCLARIAKHLDWSAYIRQASHYLKLAKTPGTAQKPCVRALVAILKGFHFDLEQDERLRGIVMAKLLPDLLAYVEKRDAADEEMRIPIGEGASAVIQHLPGTDRDVQQSALMMALAAILRSKDQSVRDATRQTISNIVATTPTMLLPAVRELRRALQRGPQLHVLAFTVHAVLVRLSELENVTLVDFDGCLEEVVPLIGYDVFGTPQKERSSTEFKAKTKFKEVKSFKSIDSFQILARFISPTKISRLLQPCRDAMSATESAKTLKDVDEVLKALAAGLTANSRLDSASTLELCHSLISQNSTFLKQAKVARKNKKAAADYHVQLTRAGDDEVDHYTKNAHRFVSFGLDLFNSAFRKGHFDLESDDVLARLEPLVKLVGNTLYSEESVVLARGMRAMASLIRCKLSNVENAAPVLVKQMLNIVQRSGSTESELTQSTLRTLAIVIRDIKTATLKDEQLTELLNLIAPDLEEADRQATLFQLLRAIMSRKFVTPEIYDLMDKVAEVLVTNQSSNVREICRSIYLQFLLDYPQGRGRLRQSLTFLAKNLSFVYESGRLSVLELLSAILNKFAASLIADSAELFFASLVMVVANDDSTKCREMAAELVKVLLQRLDSDVKSTLLVMLRTWARKTEQPQLARTAVQLFGVAVEALEGDEQGKAAAIDVVDILADVLETSADRLSAAEQQGEDEDQSQLESAWQLPYQALQALAHVHKSFPMLVSDGGEKDSGNAMLWSTVRGHLLYPHNWIRTSAARLLGNLFASSAAFEDRADLPDAHALSNASLLDACQKSCLQLKSRHLNDALAMQVVKNLFFAAKCFAARRPAQIGRDEHSDSSVQDGDDDDEEEEEPVESQEQTKANDPLRWLFTRMSFQARAAHTHRPSMFDSEAGQWSLQPASILRWFAAAVSFLDKSTVEQFLVHMVTPLFRMTEDPNVQDPQMGELQTLAQEVQEVLQAKVGSTVFANAYNSVRQRAVQRRHERKTMRAQQVLNDPEQEAKRKAKRNDQKAKQRKRKNAAFADAKGRLGSSKKRRQE